MVGDAGVGKSRLFHEFTRSHRMAGLLVLESRSVSYGKATTYLPVIDLLKAYYQIDDRDDGRRIRQKVTGNLLILDEALRDLLGDDESLARLKELALALYDELDMGFWLERTKGSCALGLTGGGACRTLAEASRR